MEAVSKEMISIINNPSLPRLSVDARDDLMLQLDKFQKSDPGSGTNYGVVIALILKAMEEVEEMVVSIEVVQTGGLVAVATVLNSSLVNGNEVEVEGSMNAAVSFPDTFSNDAGSINGQTVGVHTTPNPHGVGAVPVNITLEIVTDIITVTL